MAILDTSNVIAVKFDVTTIQSLNGLNFTHQAGDIILLPQNTPEITIDITGNVACMTGLLRGVVMGFVMNEIRTSA